MPHFNNLLSTLSLAFTSNLFFHLSTSSISPHTYGDSLPNSCIGLPDGDHWLLLSTSSESYQPIELTCSNEYMILDVNKDANLIPYFSSFQKWHYAIGGPANSDPVNWNEWFLPEMESRSKNYLISPDCSSCNILSSSQVFNTDTSYYMTGNLAKLMWGVIGFNECDFDKDSYQCYNCESCFSEESGAVCEPEPYNELTIDYTKAGICGVAVQSSNMDIPRTRTLAQTPGGNNHYKPSIGTDGRFCVCYQPSIDNIESYSLSEEQESVIEKKEVEDSVIEEIKEGKEGNEGSGQGISSEIAQSSEMVNRKGGYKGYQRVDGHEIEKEVSASKVDVADLREVNTVYLQQKHFEKGTLRIKQSGTYIITENIIFDFGRDDDYWPREDQNDEYEGAGEFSGPYHLGFFAGIAIEADYVTIDLNGKELRMSNEFYYQQRWFATIELGNQQFLPGQGPAFFGPESINVQDITIKNGILGLTSHMGIHGNFPNNLRIENVHIRDFNTHGLQLNGWNGLTMNNVEIGPSSTYEYLRGDYAHARILLQRLRVIESQMIETNTVNKKLIKFDQRGEYTITDIIKELESQMNIAFHYAMNRMENKFIKTGYMDPVKYDVISGQTRYRVESAIKQFIQKSGLPSASSVQGMFLNFMGASVFSYAKYTTHLSNNGNLNNIYIHDIKHDMIESIRFAKMTDSGQTFPTPWNSDIPGEGALGSIEKAIEFRNEAIKSENKEKLNLEKFKYIGNVMTDAYIAMAHFSDDWDMLGFLLIKKHDDDSFEKWVRGDDVAPANWRFGCNQDVMGHSGKGLIGLRIDGVENLKLNNIRIENLESHSGLGSMACGEYSSHNMYGEGGHFKQRPPMQVGYSGNNLQGLSIVSSKNIELGNIDINNLVSHYGEGYALSLWTANDIKVNQDSLIKVYNIQTGKMLEKDTLTYTSYPNRAPEACGVRIEVDEGDIYSTNIEFESTDDKLNIVTCGVSGHEMCLGNKNKNENELKTMFGTYLSDDWTRCQRIQTHKQLKSIINNKNNKNNADMIDNNINSEKNKKVSINNNFNKDRYTLVPMIAIMVIGAIVSIISFVACSKRCNISNKDGKGWVYAEVDTIDEVMNNTTDNNDNSYNESLGNHTQLPPRYGTV